MSLTVGKPDQAGWLLTIRPKSIVAASPRWIFDICLATHHRFDDGWSFSLLTFTFQSDRHDLHINVGAVETINGRLRLALGEILNT